MQGAKKDSMLCLWTWLKRLTVGIKGLWMIMERLSCPSKFLSMVIQLHKDQCSQVRLNSDLSGSLPVVNGVKQGCVLALSLFSIFFSMMLKQVTEDLDDNCAMYIRYRLDDSLTSRDCMPTQKHLSSYSVTSFELTTLPSLQKESCST